jgi:O-antigen/teichoic acid export membrane protein
MSSIRAFARNLLFSGISAATNVFGLLLLMEASRDLTLDDMGVLGIAFAFAAIGEPLMDLGIQQASVRHIARDRSTAGDILANSLPLKTLTAVAMFAVLSGVALWWYPAAAPASMLMLVSVVIRSYLLTIRGLLQGLEEFRHDAAVMFADRVLMFGGGVVALRLGYGVTGLAGSFIATRSLALGLAFWLTRPHVGRLRVAYDFPLWRELRDNALPLGLFMMVLTVYNYVDVLILGALTSEQEVGLYHNAYRVYEAVTYGAAIVWTVLTPRFAALWATDRAAHARLARLAVVGSAALGIGITPFVWWLAPTGLALIFGPAYGAASGSLRILAGGLGFVFVIWMLHSLAMSTFNARLLLTATLISLAVNVGVNLWLIPSWHRDGAAAATVAGEAVAFGVLAWGLRGVLFRRAAAPS